MKRREFIGIVGGVAAWPLAARAQQPDRMRRIGVLFAGKNGDVNIDQRQAVFAKALNELGWTDGKTVQIDYRRAENDVGLMQSLAKELVSLKPDVIFAPTQQVVAAFQRETKTIPIVFVFVADPVASGFVESLSHPGGNITGFYNYDLTVLGKYVELLKEMSPGIAAVSVLFNPENIVAPGAVDAIYLEAGRYHAVEMISAPVRGDEDIERVIFGLGRKSAQGLVVLPDPLFTGPRTLNLITSLATRYRVPAVYSFRFFVAAGGLISYGNDLTEQVREAATYIDRLLRGAAASELPVQAPTKYELIINLRTAKEMGLTIPPTMLARADEVIE
jgi:putative tryptophan/tyrosine transport system substrate-binding protein